MRVGVVLTATRGRAFLDRAERAEVVQLRFAGAGFGAHAIGQRGSPLRESGARVALLSLAVEAAGLRIIGFSSGIATAEAGALLVGFGYSLVYPGFGAEAVRAAPRESRGLAMGIYTAFLDVALGLGTPALGWIAGAASLGTVFLVSVAVVQFAAPAGLILLRRSPARTSPAQRRRPRSDNGGCATSWSRRRRERPTVRFRKSGDLRRRRRVGSAGEDRGQVSPHRCCPGRCGRGRRRSAIIPQLDGTEPRTEAELANFCLGSGARVRTSPLRANSRRGNPCD